MKPISATVCNSSLLERPVVLWDEKAVPRSNPPRISEAERVVSKYSNMIMFTPKKAKPLILLRGLQVFAQNTPRSSGFPENITTVENYPWIAARLSVMVVQAEPSTRRRLVPS